MTIREARTVVRPPDAKAVGCSCNRAFDLKAAAIILAILVAGTEFVASAHGQEGQSSPAPGASGDTGASYMQQLSQPAGSGRTGPRTFSKTKFDAGDVAWVSLAAMGTLLIAPGWLFFYSGGQGKIERARIAESWLILAVIESIVWGLFTYSLAFAPNMGALDLPENELVGIDGQFSGLPIIGGTSHMALQGFEPQAAVDAREFPLRRRTDLVPHVLFMIFQMFTAVVALAPLVVVLANRVRTSVLISALMAWSIVVYVPLAHWIWGFGWLRQMGVQDFAGGAVLHIAAGFSAVALLPFLSRPASVDDSPEAAPVPGATGLVCLGAGLLWAGLLLLNGGSAVGAGPTAINAMLNAHVAACAGAIGWAGAEWLRRGSATIGDLVAGLAAGLVTISAGSGLVAPQTALLIGMAGGIVCRAACHALARRHAGPIMTVFGIQGVGGFLGMLLAGVFASSNYAGADHSRRLIEGLLTGNFLQLRLQAIASGTAALLAVLGTLLIFGIVRLIAGPQWIDSPSPAPRSPAEEHVSNATSA